MTVSPKFTLNKIKFATDRPTFEKAVELCNGGKITQFKDGIGSYSALILGGKPYHVSIEAHRYGLGYCDCYLGQRDMLCKHMVALSIYVVMNGKPLSVEDIKLVDAPRASGTLGELSKADVAARKKAISEALRYIKPYNGPSRTWFAYQGSLAEGCARLSEIVSRFPISEQCANILVDLLLRLDKKLCRGGVDDSDGTVGIFMEEVVQMLKTYADLEPSCKNAFHKLKDIETCFGWEESLVKMITARK